MWRLPSLGMPVMCVLGLAVETMGWGTRPTRVLRRGRVEVLTHRAPLPGESGVLPPTSVVVECSADGERLEFAIGVSAFTGFVSWLESSAPR